MLSKSLKPLDASKTLRVDLRVGLRVEFGEKVQKLLLWPLKGSKTR